MSFDIVLEYESAERASWLIFSSQFGEDEGKVVIKVREGVELLELGLDGSLGFRIGGLRFFEELNDLEQSRLLGVPGRRGQSRRVRHIVCATRDFH